MTEVGETITVFLPVYAEYSIRVEVTAEMQEENSDVDMNAVIDAAYDQIPSGLCYQCSTGNSGVGWGNTSPLSLELNNEPEAKYALDEAGNTVWGDPDAKVGW